jgi:hypothetical protein
MKILFVMLAALGIGMGCSGGGQNISDEGPPRCLDFCAMNFAQCTERNPGDYTACSDDRRSCDSECRAQHAETEVTATGPDGIAPNEQVPSQPSEEASEPIAPEDKPTDVPPAE